jgi:NAD(P)-dependent dehydrogenase (short-subunit alcohol dehydrogenase family)
MPDHKETFMTSNTPTATQASPLANAVFSASALEGKVALITGAAAGIGLATAKAMAACGAKVMMADLPESDGAAQAEVLTREGKLAAFVPVDVANAGSVQAMVETTRQRFGRLDIAINNAGISGADGSGVRRATADVLPDSWRKVLAVNLDGVFYCMQAQIPLMLASGGGAIVNISSILGSVGFAHAAAYTASKHAVVGLTKVAALEYSAKGIRVNAIGPGFIETAMTAPIRSQDESHRMLVASHPIGRLGQPEEIAHLALFLSSPAASFITGAYYVDDGGYTAR